MSDDEPSPLAWNHVHEGSTAFIRDRTLHKIRERNGYRATAQCGVEFHAELKQLADADAADDVSERHKCGRCFP